MRSIVFKLIPLLILAGCVKPGVGIRTEIVEVPVIQVEHCVSPEDIPVRPSPLQSGRRPTDLETALSLALAKLSEWVRYGNQTEVVLRGCVE